MKNISFPSFPDIHVYQTLTQAQIGQMYTPNIWKSRELLEEQKTITRTLSPDWIYS